MTSIVIVESPAKCKKIESFLGKGYKCVASFGHIRHLDAIHAPFKPHFKLLPNKMKYIKKLKTAVKHAKEVILATDDDREGEAIAWHLCIYLKLPVSTTKRIIFHEITKAALQQAIQNPTHINMNKVYAQQARQMLDRLIGFTISPLLWKQFYHGGPKKSSLSAGRCQTPALRLVYDNQMEINASPGKQVYETTGTFKGWETPFVLDYEYIDPNKMEDFLEKSINCKHALLPPKNPTMRSKKAPLPFTTSTLQQKASNLLHFSPKRTMKLAQTLYEGGYITYMRTDSKKYSKEFIQTASSFIKKNWRVGDEYLRQNMNYIRVGTAKQKNAQEAHEAIRPTKVEKKSIPVTIGVAEKNLYALIWKNTVESCMSEAQAKHISLSIEAPEKHKYTCHAEQIIFPGWLIVGGYEKKNALFHQCEAVKKKKPIEYSKIYSKFVMKQLKKHYTEARLVQMLEKKGIGRPSTFSSLIDKIQTREYVTKMNIPGRTLCCTDYKLVSNELSEIEVERCCGNENNKLVIQPLGIMVIEFLISNLNSLFQYTYTKQMEDALDLISKGKAVSRTICKACNDEMDALMSNISEDNQRIRIDDHHVYMVARYGPVIKYEKDGEVQFKKVKKGIDLGKLRKGEYVLSDLIVDTPTFTGRRLGSFKNEEVLLKKGRYGLYIACGKKNYSIKGIKKSENNIVLEDVIDILLGKKSNNPKVLLVINDTMSVRNGKYGAYIFYKTEAMKKPRFLKLKGIQWKDYTPSGLFTWATSEYNL